MRRSSSRTPSERSSNQSPPPGRTSPRSRGPSKSPPGTGTMLRMPWGTEPSFCGGAAAILTVISGREFMTVSLPFAGGRRSLRPTLCAHSVKALVAPARTDAATALSTSLRRTSMRRLPSFRVGASLKDLFDRVDRSAGAAIARRDSDQSVQERILRRARFEPGGGPKVVPGRIDGLAPRQRSQHFRRAVTEAERRHINQRAVVGLEDDAQVELENAVGAQQRPVTSARQDLAAQPRAFEGAARNRRYHAYSMRHSAELLRRRDDNLQRHQQT